MKGAAIHLNEKNGPAEREIPRRIPPLKMARKIRANPNAAERGVMLWIPTEPQHSRRSRNTVDAVERYSPRIVVSR